MATLFIFGNGFDIHYNLPTRTSDFINNLRKEKVYGTIDDAAAVFEYYDVLWSNFEEDIADLNLDEIEEEHLSYPDYLSDHEYDRDGCIYDVRMHLDGLQTAIDNALTSMTKEADDCVSALKSNYDIPFAEGDAIVSFNYTSTVEELYLNNLDYSLSVFHIHGFGREHEKLILGYAQPKSNYNDKKFSNSEDGDYYLEQQVGLIKNFYDGLKKELQLSQLSLFLDKFKRIDQVVVYGHALGSVDAPYFELINDKLHTSKWSVSYHGEEDPVLTNAEKLSFFKNITFFEF